MSRNHCLSALLVVLCLVPSACARTGAKVPTPEPDGRRVASPSAAKADAPETVRAANAQPQPEQTATAPTAVSPAGDKDLVREYARFSLFAQEQVARMNANIIGGKRHMRVRRGHDGLYHALYKAIDVPGVVCQVRRSVTDPRYYVGNLIYTEELLESTGKSATACRRGQFAPVSKEGHRLIYTSKRGGGWR